MKLWDTVKVIHQKTEYEQLGIKKGMIGFITDAEMRGNCFNVEFELSNEMGLFAEWVNIEDLSMEKEGDAPDELIIKMLPNNNPDWWCKVENGYILNLKGERKNKIPYDYNS